MQGFALAVLAAVLAELDLPAELWDEATGRCLSGRGTYHLTFNHFRPGVRARGLNVHKDSGWVTVLRSLEPGLEIDLGRSWLPIAPRPGCFIVNFGCAMEILTRQSRTPVAAVAHRVVEQPDTQGQRPDRFSYALFVDSSLDESVCPGLFSYRPGHGLELAMRFHKFLDEILKNTYQKDTLGLY
jgi:isopenicillin N synthase-like dioxygenase